MRQYLLIAPIMALMSLMTSQAIASPVVKSGVAVFGNTAFDLSLGLERDGSIVSSIRDCSTEMTYCLQGGALRFALPAKCSYTFDQRASFQAGDILTTELDRYVLSGETIHLLGTKDHQGFVYVYTRRGGLLGFYRRIDAAIDLEREAMAQHLRASSFNLSSTIKGVAYSPHVTLEGVAACR